MIIIINTSEIEYITFLSPGLHALCLTHINVTHISRNIYNRVFVYVYCGDTVPHNEMKSSEQHLNCQSTNNNIYNNKQPSFGGNLF